MDFSKVEMNPQIAFNQFGKLIQFPGILNESIIVMLMVKYEDAISGIYRFLIEAFPQAYLSDKSITYSDLLLLGSDFVDIKEKFVRKEIEEFMRLPVDEWYKSFKSKQKVKFDFAPETYDCFKEIYLRRNLVVHNQGIANEQYIKNVPGCQAKPGDRLLVNEDYLTKAFSTTRTILIGTVWGLRKTAEDIKNLTTYLFEYGYQCLTNAEWNIAEFIFAMLLNERDQKEVDRTLEQINLWIAKKNKDGLETIKNEVRSLDISAMQNKFSIAKHALLDEFDEVSAGLESAILNDIPAFYIKEWPLFIQYRESAQYKTFVERHKDLFETDGYEPNDETIGDPDDIINELGEEYDGNVELDHPQDEQ